MKNPGRTDILLSAAAPALTVFFFVPFSLYLTNRQMFFAAPFNLAVLLLSVSACVCLLSAFPVLLLKGKARTRLFSLYAFLCAALWAQAYLLNWDYGLLDGSPLRWRLFELRSLVDVAVWAILFGYVAVRGAQKKSSLRGLLLLLLFMQSGSLAYNWMAGRTGAFGGRAREYAVTFQDQFVFSTEKNIVVLVLDAYQTDFFNQYMEENPDYRDRLPGFTYYPNALAEYHYTNNSIPSLLTGNYLIKSALPSGKTLRHYRSDFLKEHSLPALLKKADYHVGVYPYYAHHVYTPAIFGEIADNYQPTTEFARNESNEFFGLMAVALFRITPHPLKKKVHERFLSGIAFEQDRDEFLHYMKRQSRVGINRPALRYYHLQGLHGPNIVNGERLDNEARGDVLTITGLVNEMLADFAATLQTLGVYDTSAIFVVADHGLYHDSRRVDYGAFGGGDQQAQNAPVLDPFVKKCRALPLFLYKPPSARGALEVSRAPVCLVDVMPTILDSVDIPATHPVDGKSVHDLKQEDGRLRRHFTSEIKRGADETPDYEFIVSGFSWFDSSWAYTGNAHFWGKKTRRVLDNYVLATPLHFGNCGGGIQYLDEHWRALEHAHLLEERPAELTLPVANPAKNMVLSLEIAPHGKNGNPHNAIVAIFINGENMGAFDVVGKQKIEAAVPFDPLWQQAPPPPQEENSTSLWDWSPTPPPISRAVVNVRMELAGDSAPLELLSLQIDPAL